MLLFWRLIPNCRKVIGDFRILLQDEQLSSRQANPTGSLVQRTTISKDTRNSRKSTATLDAVSICLFLNNWAPVYRVPISGRTRTGLHFQTYLGSLATSSHPTLARLAYHPFFFSLILPQNVWYIPLKAPSTSLTLTHTHSLEE